MGEPFPCRSSQNLGKTLTPNVFIEVHAIPGTFAKGLVAGMEGLRDENLAVFQPAPFFVSYGKGWVNHLGGHLHGLLEDHGGDIFGELREFRVGKELRNFEDIEQKKALVSFLDDRVRH